MIPAGTAHPARPRPGMGRGALRYFLSLASTFAGANVSETELMQ